MNKALAIAARELSGRRSIFLTAAVLAVIPYAVLLMPEVQRYGRSSAVAMTGIFVAACYIFGLALLLGGTFVGQELLDKRLSFYFAKPVGAAAIWFGKLCGSLLTIACSAAIIVVPVLLGSGDELPRLLGMLGWFALGALTLFLFAHVVATMLRSRSQVVLADCVAAAIAGALVYLMVHQLLLGAAAKLVDLLLWSFTIGGLAIMTAAGAWQLAHGRIDPRANHRELSKFLWTATAVMLVIAGAAVLWVVSAGPEDLDEHIAADQVPMSDWVIVSGNAKHRGDYRATFARNAVTGEHQRLSARDMWWGGFFARQGRVAGRVRKTRELELLHFTADRVTIAPTRVTVPYRSELVPSDDLTRVALITPDMVTIESLADGRTLAAARRVSGSTSAFFVTPDVLRVFYSSERQVDIHELDVRTKSLVQTGSFSTDGRASFSASPDGSRLLAQSMKEDGDELLVLDGRTGARIGSLGVQEKGTCGVILTDGRILTVNPRNVRTLSIYGSDLALQRQVALPGVVYIWLLREVDSGRILLAGTDRAPELRKPSDWSLRVIDASSGAVVRNERAIRPVQMSAVAYEGTDPRREVLAAGAPLIVYDAAGKLKRVSL